jgi:hypothetical protein
MAKATRRGALAVVAAVVLLGLGAGVGIVVGDALGIRAEAADPMQTPDAASPVVATVVAPPELSRIDAPGSPQVDLAIEALHAAVADAPATAGTATLTVAIGDGRGSDLPAGADAYRLSGTPSALRIDAGDESGAARGVYDLAAAIRSGRPVDALIGTDNASRLPLRMADLGAVGVTPDPELWADGTDYSHVSRAFEDVYLPDAPYIDRAALADASADWERFLARIVALGYNAVAWPGFVEFTTFAGVEGVYPDGDPHVARALALRDAFGPLWERAAELG